jgi:hypothetical protein
VQKSPRNSLAEKRFMKRERLGHPPPLSTGKKGTAAELCPVSSAVQERSVSLTA